MKRFFQKIINDAIKNAFNEPVNDFLKTLKPKVEETKDNQTDLNKILDRLKTNYLNDDFTANSSLNYNMSNLAVAPLTTASLSGLTNGSLNNYASIPTVNLSNGLNHLSGLTSSMVLEASEKHSLNRPCSFNIKLYHAIGGYVAEISKYNEDEKLGYNSKPGALHILQSEHLGEQLEKAIAYESLRQ
jgi:hypothetical protein